MKYYAANCHDGLVLLDSSATNTLLRSKMNFVFYLELLTRNPVERFEPNMGLKHNW